MHRGCRIQAISGSADALSEWDPTLASDDIELVTGPGRDKDPVPWGIVGHQLDDVPTSVPIDEEVRTPLATLEPLMGWSESEVEALRARVFG
jgi:hypothetical protein